MFVISTRNFPPEIGGMQNLMGGLSLSLLKHGPVKVFAEKTNMENNFDKNVGTVSYTHLTLPTKRIV